MADVNESLQQAMALEGAIGAALVDWQSGMTLGTAGGGPHLNLDVVAAGTRTRCASSSRSCETSGWTTGSRTSSSR